MNHLSSSSALACSLTKHKKLINERIAQARRLYLGLDMESFSTLLTGPVAKVIDSLEDSIDECALTAVDTLLIMARHGFLISPYREILASLWTDVLAGCTALVSSAPHQVIGRLHNVLLNMRSRSVDFFRAWIDSLAAVAPFASTKEELFALASVLIWKNGNAAYRKSALAAAKTLPSALVLRVFNAADMSGQEVLNRLGKDRWYNPSLAEPVGFTNRWIVGGFLGNGGPFIKPVSVRVGSDGFILSNGLQAHHLFVDAFGCEICPMRDVPQPVYKKSFLERAEEVSRSGRWIVHKKTKVPLHFMDEDAAITCDNDTVVVFSPWSYYLQVLSLPPQAPV